MRCPRAGGTPWLRNSRQREPGSREYRWWFFWARLVCGLSMGKLRKRGYLRSKSCRWWDCVAFKSRPLFLRTEIKSHFATAMAHITPESIRRWLEARNLSASRAILATAVQPGRPMVAKSRSLVTLTKRFLSSLFLLWAALSTASTRDRLPWEGVSPGHPMGGFWRFLRPAASIRLAPGFRCYRFPTTARGG